MDRVSLSSVHLHYNYTNRKIPHHCITTQEVSVAHNAENLANEFEEVLNLWGIRYRIYGAATTDNAQNIRNVIVDSMELHHLGCVGYTLQSNVNKPNSTYLSCMASRKS